MSTRLTVACITFCIVSSTVLFLTDPLGGFKTLELEKTKEAMGLRTDYFGEAIFQVFQGGRPKGTAFAVAYYEEAGTICVTAKHVLGNLNGAEVQPPAQGDACTVVSVAFPDLDLPPGVVFGSSEPCYDVTVFVIPGYKASVLLPLAKNPARVGDRILSIGAVPLGLTITEGFIGKFLPTDPTAVPPILLTMHSARVYGGCSGGPVLNERGEVIGLNTWRWSRGGMGGMTPLPPIRTEVRKAVPEGYDL
jgi:S1-C subfamily serine protease